MRIWLGFYFFYSGDWEHFLRTSVFAIVKQVMSNNLAEQFFFVRYWENGPHIRLRFKGHEDKLYGEVKSLVEKAFEEYLSKFPKVNNQTDNSYQGLVYNRILRIVPYEAEIHRYGGDKGMAICEKHFQHSSEAVFNSLIENPTWNYTNALGTAIQMHIGFALKTGMTNNEAYEFFFRQFQNWFPSAIHLKIKASQQELDKYKSDVLAAFSESYENQRYVLEPFAKAIYQGIKYDVMDLSSSWFSDWCENIELMHIEILNLKKQGRLFIPNSFKEALFLVRSMPDEWYLYESLCHMTNNRLGIQNQDEGFIGFILARLFKFFSNSN